MKVLYVVESAAPYGANKCLIDIVDFLKKKGDEPYVVGSEYGPFSDWLSERGVPYKALGHKLSIFPSSKNSKNKMLWFLKLIAFRLINSIALLKLIFICLKFKPDIIHTNIGPTVIGYWVAKILRIRHVWHLREYQDLDFDMSFFPNKDAFIKLVENSDKVVCITKLISSHFSNPSNSIVIYDGVLEQLGELQVCSKSEYLLFVGRLEPTKGIEEVIRAFLKFSENSNGILKLKIAGNGESSYVSYLKELVDASDYSNSVDFLGFRTDINELMRSALALVVPSKCEGFGLITAEAMFNGCVVIGRNSGGTSEILGNLNGQDFGLLFNTDEELIQCFNLLLELTDDELKTIADRAYSEAQTKYLLSTQHNLLYQIYLDMMKIEKR